MMKRIILLAAAWLTCSGAAAQELLLLEGQITSGQLVHPRGSGPYSLIEEFPVPYTAVFNYQPSIQLATFEFRPIVDGQANPQFVEDNLFPGVVRNDPLALVVDYTTQPISIFIETFDLSLDKTTGQGAWEWREDCLICDQAFTPSATATITGFKPLDEADFDEDEDVDEDDLAQWADGFGLSEGAGHGDGDAEGDRDADGADFLTWQRQLGLKTPPNAATGVPEPTSLVLAAALALLLAGHAASRSRGED